MNIEDVKVGMKVVFTEDIYIWKVGDIRTVESIDRDRYIWTPEMRCTNPSRVRPATPEDIAPKLWQSYKDALNDEALEALEQVIMGEHSGDLNFTDAEDVEGAFNWNATPQGADFWLDVANGEYNKQEEHTVTKFDFTNTKINIKKYADENGITLDQASKEYAELVGKEIPQPYFGFSKVVYLFSNNLHEIASLGCCNADEEDYFNSRSEKEITLTRTVTITPSFAIPDTITLPDGRTVLKKDYDKALSELKTYTN